MCDVMERHRHPEPSPRSGALDFTSPAREWKGNLPDAGSLSAAFDLPGMRRREAGGAFCGLHRFVRLTDAGGVEPPLPVLETGVLPSYEASSTFKTKPPSGSAVLRGIVVVDGPGWGVWGREDSNLRVFQVKTARYLTTCMTGSATSPSVPFTPCGGRRNGRSPLVSQGMLHLTSRPDAGLFFFGGPWETGNAHVIRHPATVSPCVGAQGEKSEKISLVHDPLTFEATPPGGVRHEAFDGLEDADRSGNRDVDVAVVGVVGHVLGVLVGDLVDA